MSSPLYLNQFRQQPPAIARRAHDIAAQLSDIERTRGIADLLQQPVSPLVSLNELARRFGIHTLYAKDERDRYGLGSFKAIGGVYAVACLAADALSRRCRKPIAVADVLRGTALPVNHITFAAATAGNHGRAVAFGAKQVGANAIIFVHDGVPEASIKAIAALGAQIVRVAGDYEYAVSLCASQCRANDWQLVSDFADPGYQSVPLRIMQGYAVIAGETVDALRSPPTHVFVQAGVGGLATSLSAYFTANYTPAPRIIVVEAAATPCLQDSARNSRLIVTPHTHQTVMGRLECRKPSSLAWPLLAHEAAAFAAVDDGAALESAQDLSKTGLPTTPSGAAGLAGLKYALSDHTAREALDLNSESRVLIVVTEQNPE